MIDLILNKSTFKTSSTNGFIDYIERKITAIAFLILGFAICYYLFKEISKIPESKKVCPYEKKDHLDSSRSDGKTKKLVDLFDQTKIASQDLRKPEKIEKTPTIKIKTTQEEADAIITVLGERPLESAKLRMFNGKSQEVRDLVNKYYAAKEKILQATPIKKTLEATSSEPQTPLRPLNINRVGNSPIASKGTPWSQMLNWVNMHVGAYGIQVNNAKDFQDGRAFCALADILVKGTFSLSSEIGNEARLNLAFKTLEDVGVPKLLDAEDLVLIADQKSIYTYLTMIHKKHNGS